MKRTTGEGDRTGPRTEEGTTMNQSAQEPLPKTAVRHPRPKSRITAAVRAIKEVELKWNEPLARHTTFRVGGPVWCLARPRTERALSALLAEARDREAPVCILGGGSNVLPPDHPWDALVIQLNLSCRKLFRFQENGSQAAFVYAGAGSKLSEAIRYGVTNELEGFEPLVGIPGTIGGALVMNAGTAHGAIADNLLWIDLIDAAGRRLRVPKYDLSPAYRSMGLPEESVVVGGCFKLRASSAQAQKAKLSEWLKERKRKQPTGFPSAGSVFRNPEGKFAAELIEKTGLKGLRIGGAEVSRKHANWIVNRGGATAREILALIRKIENEVFGTFGVRLEREIRILGQ
jgi:UDP-N-acetylmuramate dehydrogenase